MNGKERKKESKQEKKEKERNIYDKNVCLKDGKQYSESVGNSREDNSP